MKGKRSYIGGITFENPLLHPCAMTPRTQPAAMPTALLPHFLASLRQPGDNAAPRHGHALAPTQRSYSINISNLPAPDQPLIWAFLEFMHEYSSTAWRLVAGADADIWFVNSHQATANLPSAASKAPLHATVHVLPHTPPAGQLDNNMLVRPLRMEAFAAVLQRMEAQLQAVRPAALA